MSNVFYKPPKRFASALGVVQDTILNVSAQQYGGFTVAHLDKVMSPYIEMSYNEYYKEYQTIALSTLDIGKMSADEYKKSLERINNKAEVYATGKVRGEVYQGVQALEHKLNTIPSSRGDFAFVTCTFGLGSDKWSKMFSEALMDVRAKGQGEPAVPVLFPKLVFITDLDGLHGEGKPNHDLWLKACDTANVCMYPDQLSVSNPNDYVGRIYKKYGKAISPMGKEILQLM